MTTALADLQLLASGKVREMYEVDDDLLMVASDRISAYDVVLPTPIPDKGKVLTQMSVFWFETTGDIVPNHLPLPGRARGGRGQGAAGEASSRCTRSSASPAAISRARAGASTARPEPSAGSSFPRG